jgi:putative ABC transport system permease protein
MAAAWLALRAGLRSRWRPLLALALLLGVAGGVVLTAAAGARRTDTAYPRLLRSANAAQLLVIGSQYSPPGYFAGLRRLPQVASLSEASLYDVVLPGRHGPGSTTVQAFSSPNDSFGVTADRVKLLAGRLFRPGEPRAVMVDPQLAALEHVHPGSTLHLYVVPGADVPQLSRARDIAFRVSAVVLFDSQVVPGSRASAGPMALISPPFARTRLARSASYGVQAGVRLRPGGSTQAVLQAARALARRYPAAGGLDATNLADQVAATQRAIHPQAIALGLFAGLAALVVLAVLIQLLSRQVSLDAVEFPVLHALGLTRRGLLAVALARLAVVTTVAAVLAVAIGIAASPLMPIGPARLAEPDPGLAVDPLVLGLGGAAIVTAPLLLLLPTAWRAAGRPAGPLGTPGRPAPERASRLGAALARAGLVTGSAGVRMAFEPGRGRTAVPVRSALAGTIVAVAAVVAALVFGTSLVRLVATPRLYGQDWQQQLDLQFGAVPRPLLDRILAGQPGVAGYAIGNYGQVTVHGRIVPAISVQPVRGARFVTLLAGRAPARPGEIALGAQPLRALHLRLGQRIPVGVNGGRRAMRIVGTAVLPLFSRGSFEATGLGSGAVATAPVLSQPNATSGCPARAHLTCYSFVLLRYRPGTDLRGAAARLSRVTHRNGCPPGSCVVVSDQRPDDIRDYAGVRDTPLVLGVLLALLAVGTLAHVLVTGVRRRRRDLAVLKALGLVRWQVHGVVQWQAAALTATALLAGVPLGILAGRWAWAQFAAASGVSPGAAVPVPVVLALIPAVLALTALIAAGPARAAARVSPAAVLRAE